MRRLTWVVKASKLCNLRCAYCYEWNELSDPRRMQLSEWERVFEAMRAHRARSARTHPSSPVQASLVIHGGEPLLLPLPYLERVLDLSRAILGDDLRVALQTNLYDLSDAQLSLLARARVEVGVSLDVVGGVRVSLTGKETEARVRKNLARLLARDVRVGGITVVAKHTAAQIRDIYAFYRALRLPLRVLPLFRGPDERDLSRFGLSEDAIVSALSTLFEHWVEDPERIPITPLAEYFEIALRQIVGAEVEPYDRAVQGDSVLLVNTNGDLYCNADAYVVDHRLGNVFTQSYDEIVGSEAHRASIAREARERDRACGRCAFRGACSTWPLFESRSERVREGDCGITARICAFIEQWLRREGYAEQALAALR